MILTARRATLDDLEAITDVVLAAMPLDPQWDYRFCHRWRWAKEHRTRTRTMLLGFIGQPDSAWTVMVVEMTDVDDASYQKPVAVAVWNRDPYAHALKARANINSRIPFRNDANMARMERFKKVTRKTQAHFFDNVYDHSYLFLQMLATHPDYQRRGAGACLVAWGMRVAREGGIPLGVLASPMGLRLYSKLGFLSLGSAVVKRKCEDDSVTLRVMVFNPDELLLI